MSKLTRREFAAAAGAGLLVHPLLARAQAPASPTPTGPMVGHVSDHEAHFWCRPSKAGRYELVVLREGREVQRQTATALPENDLCVNWRVTELDPGVSYDYAVLDETGKAITDGAELGFATPPFPETAAKVCLAFGSCAHTKPSALWAQIALEGAQGLVLLGDTPYIDSTDLNVQRTKHRDFLAVPDIAALIRRTPTWATWDDHDFGKNDSDGTLPGKENSRQAFLEYRANAGYGHEDQGIYTKFRWGCIEVFLLDTRWFSRTESSPVDPDQPTLLGAKQWNWLKESLLASTAPFKLITCGMIWDDKENRESDDWGTYSYERAALFDFIGEHAVSGVVLIGGDIHCSRLLQYKTEEQVGYPIRQCIVSPIHDSTIPSLNVAHPDLVRGEAIPHVWLRVEADNTVSPPVLKAEWRQMNNVEMWSLELSETDLTKNAAKG